MRGGRQLGSRSLCSSRVDVRLAEVALQAHRRRDQRRQLKQDLEDAVPDEHPHQRRAADGEGRRGRGLHLGDEGVKLGGRDEDREEVHPVHDAEERDHRVEELGRDAEAVGARAGLHLVECEARVRQAEEQEEPDERLARADKRRRHERDRVHEAAERQEVVEDHQHVLALLVRRRLRQHHPDALRVRLEDARQGLQTEQDRADEEGHRRRTGRERHRCREVA